MPFTFRRRTHVGRHLTLNVGRRGPSLTAHTGRSPYTARLSTSSTRHWDRAGSWWRCALVGLGDSTVLLRIRYTGCGHTR